MKKESRLVYSTDRGRIKETSKTEIRREGDGVVRIQRETKGRKGKGVTCVRGLGGTDAELKLLLAELKKRCGCGGALKDGVIEIQGDKRSEVKALLEAKGFTVKMAGG
ncbi:stress response translation initiation inhibitor YciH [Microbulbifer thermotolerans]|uniref:Translation initiation factor Sui1 n=1 Tax=Microbulbifer thermotolerans TaxID=252514 RepID=A0A143HRT7_MICTH|nr:stress response translation initiation inhibitor YciH [Microbulbifer thermotolerans]AMX04120.1 translation initiation factor Sui1 [Microbulbifer thermotolerans]MCX2780995.1 stress response translation initiation inhibitor YciH [Microbulbifer thermotolerans]MCX2795213.1 stress response translation initiation inhibitor YciH [Microbulbifer thermotolerans]MCX2806516.1 stress response translation initiation inhibitor YciH [Microbulbifer thermotolerans]MCX2834371.1 stress response translation ini